MLLLGVKVVIGTDGGHLYNTTLAKEYGYAERCLQKFRNLLLTSDEPVTLLNGDQLRVRHIESLVTSDMSTQHPDHLLTYRALASSIDHAILKRLSCEQLVQNARELLKACYNL
jgi:hypothetical protein